MLLENASLATFIFLGNKSWVFMIYSGKMETETVGHLPFLLSTSTEEKRPLWVQKSNPGGYELAYYINFHSLVNILPTHLQ
jgi:hypothetical protein